MSEHSRCDICNCIGTWGAEPRTPDGRSRLTHRALVPDTFFGRNRKTRYGRHDAADSVFDDCPWDCERETRLICLECRDELLGQPVLLAWDVARLASLIRQADFAEERRTTDRSKMAGRVELFREVISRGLEVLIEERVCPFEPFQQLAGYPFRSFWQPAGPFDEWMSRREQSRARDLD